MLNIQNQKKCVDSKPRMRRYANQKTEVNSCSVFKKLIQIKSKRKLISNQAIIIRKTNLKAKLTHGGGGGIGTYIPVDGRRLEQRQVLQFLHQIHLRRRIRTGGTEAERGTPHVATAACAVVMVIVAVEIVVHGAAAATAGDGGEEFTQKFAGKYSRISQGNSLRNSQGTF